MQEEPSMSQHQQKQQTKDKHNLKTTLFAMVMEVKVKLINSVKELETTESDNFNQR